MGEKERESFYPSEFCNLSRYSSLGEVSAVLLKAAAVPTWLSRGVR